jgi:hypothetical protein
LTDAEARSSSCAICGGSLTATPAASAPADAPLPGVKAGGARWGRWLGGATVGAALAILALLLWQRHADPVDGVADRATAAQAVTVAKSDRPVEHPATPPAAKKIATAGRDRADVAYPSDVASAKAPGDAVTDGDVGARAKPAPEPQRVEPPAPQVANERPVPPADFPQAMPLLPGFQNQPFAGPIGGRQLVDNDIDQLLKMAMAQQQELQKLFKMAGMQELDLLRGTRPFQGIGGLQLLPQPRPLIGAPSDAGEIVLTGNGITDRDLAALGSKKSLRALSLAGTSVTDAGLDHLKGLQGLRRLNLSGTRITDKGLEALHGLRELRELDLSNTRVSDAGSKRLQQALPDVEITR